MNETRIFGPPGTGFIIRGGKRRRVLSTEVCAICGEEFPRWKPKQTTCGRICANTLIARRSAEQRGAAQRGRGEGRTYRKVNGRHEHRVIAEQKIGRPLEPGEVVHHIDGDKFNNDPSNLEVITQSEHINIHLPEMIAVRWGREAAR